VETDDAGRPLGDPAQLAVVVEGVTPGNLKALKDALPQERRQTSFVIRDPPSARANQFLLDSAHEKSGAARSSCTTASAANPFDPKCWIDGVFVRGYDVRESPDSLGILIRSLPKLLVHVENGELEAMLFLMPESSRYSPVAHWTTSAPSDRLRSRSADSEAVIVDGLGAADAPSEQVDTSAPAHAWAAVGKGAIPACFQSFNSCVADTFDCSGHGRCVEKYAASNASAACFACHCFSTLNSPEAGGISTTQWAGSMCQKKDISAPFWLLAGFTVAVVGALSFAIGLLFGVGEEQLPGVIGAGVSRSK